MQRHWIPASAGMTSKRPLDQASLKDKPQEPLRFRHEIIASEMRNIEMKNVKLKASSSQSSLEDTRATIERIPTAMTEMINA